MRTLSVALVHRNSPRLLGQRMIGAWSYPVAEFDWAHYAVGREFTLNKNDLAKRHDIIIYEDGKVEGRFVGGANIPLCYVVVDSTLSQSHYKIRLSQAAQADLILIDHDRLSKFRILGKPVHRFSHCVNDRLFRDYELDKIIDVGFYCRFKGYRPRQRLHERLADFCASRGYRYDAGTKIGEEYARAFNRTKISVNLSRTADNRPHRIFDAMACKTCVLTSCLPSVSGEYRTEGVHYWEYRDIEELFVAIDNLLDSGWWYDIAEAGYDLIQEYHTWTVRAKELRQTLAEVFPWL